MVTSLAGAGREGGVASAEKRGTEGAERGRCVDRV